MDFCYSDKSGFIIEPQNTQKTSRYKITSEGRTFILTVFEGYNKFTFFLGGYILYCIHANFSRTKIGTLIDFGSLTRLRYNIYYKKIENDDTLMIRLMAAYIKNNYPSMTFLMFTDFSNFNDDKWEPFSITNTNLFIDGISWYQKHFQVRMQPEHYKIHTQIIKNANDEKMRMTWSQFCYSYLPRTTLPETKVPMEEIYNTSITWQEFFKNIRDDIGVTNLYNWFLEKSWFFLFLKLMKYDMIYIGGYITPADFSQEYTIEPFTGGWRGITRKAKRQKVSHRRRRYK